MRTHEHHRRYWLLYAFMRWLSIPNLERFSCHPSPSPHKVSLITRNATLLGPRGTTERLVWGLKLLLRKVEISTAPSGNLAISFYCQPQLKINYIYNYIIYCTVVHPTTMNLIHLLEKLIYLRKRSSHVTCYSSISKLFKSKSLDITDVTKYLYKSSLTKGLDTQQQPKLRLGRHSIFTSLD